MENQMRLMKYDIEINLINKNKILSSKILKKKINLINVDSKLNKAFSKISSKSNEYIKKCFDIGLELMKKEIGYGIINCLLYTSPSPRDQA